MMENERKILKLFEDVLKENNQEDGCIILSKKKHLSCKHHYNKNKNNIFSFNLNSDAKLHKQDIYNGGIAGYSYKSKTLYVYEGKQINIEIAIFGKIKSVYVYKNEISFAIVPDSLIIYLKNEKNEKVHFSYQKFKEYLNDNIDRKLFL